MSTKAKILVFEKTRGSSAPERRTDNGGTKRTETRGNTENKTDTRVPSTKPMSNELHEMEKPTLNGITPLRNRGIIC